MNIHIRHALPADSNHIVTLIQELAQSIGETSPITSAYVSAYLTFPGCILLLAEWHEQIAGVLSCSVRPNLYHNGNTALIEELIIRDEWRGQGPGGELFNELFSRLEEQGCIEVSVTTMPENEGAIRFYRAHGLVDEAIYLEKHFLPKRSTG